MKQVLEVYGKFLLEAIAVTVFLTLLLTGISDGKGNRGVLRITGANLPLQTVDYKSYTDTDAGLSESRKQAPQIRFLQTVMMAQGSVKLCDFVAALDDAGNALSVRIIRVKAPDGSDVTDTWNPDTAEITLEQTGVYAVTVSAKDSANRKCVKTVRIPVNE